MAQLHLDCEYCIFDYFAVYMWLIQSCMHGTYFVIVQHNSVVCALVPCMLPGVWSECIKHVPSISLLLHDNIIRDPGTGHIRPSLPSVITREPNPNMPMTI